MKTKDYTCMLMISYLKQISQRQTTGTAKKNINQHTYNTILYLVTKN